MGLRFRDGWMRACGRPWLYRFDGVSVGIYEVCRANSLKQKVILGTRGLGLPGIDWDGNVGKKEKYWIDTRCQNIKQRAQNTIMQHSGVTDQLISGSACNSVLLALIEEPRVAVDIGTVGISESFRTPSPRDTNLALVVSFFTPQPLIN